MTRTFLRSLLPALLGITLAAVPGPARPCTAVDLVAKDGTVIAGRTMEWAFDMKWKLTNVPKGTALTLTAPPSLKLPPKTVRTKHAIVGVASGVLPGTVFLDGQNAAGLSMSANFLPGFTRYQTVTPKDTNHATVAELRAALPGIKVWTDPSLPTGPTPPTVHLIVVDRTGAGLVIEYTDGELRMFDNRAHVLTNAPTYDWHLNNVRNYLNLSSVGTESVRIGSVNVTELGQGGGLVGLPGDGTPPSRFVRAAFLRALMTPPDTADQAIQAVGHVLNTVDIPIGVAQSKAGNQVVSDYTQWVAVKDLTHDTLRIADYDHRLTFVTIDLKPLFALERQVSVPVGDLPYPKAADALRSLGGS